MGSVLISAICNACNHKYPEMWVDRDLKGIPSLEGMACGICGAKNCMSRDWSDNHVSTPLIEGDGEIKRFEYSYRDQEGKLHNCKMDPSQVKKHYKNNYKDKIT
jgi:hypothetical protein